jgi:hypothetical protein
MCSWLCSGTGRASKDSTPFRRPDISRPVLDADLLAVPALS